MLSPSPAVLVAGLAGIAALLAAWEAIAAVEEERAVQSARRWLAPVLEVLRSGREPTSPERRRLVVLGTLSLLAAGCLLADLWVGLALGAAAPWVARAVLRVRLRRREAAVAAAAPAIARALADALAGGHSIRGAVATVAREGAIAGPAGEELRAAATRLELGTPTDDALLALAGGPARDREHGPLDTLAAAVLLQREAGGDLAALLRALAGALEERARVVADARSATAQARFTALLVGALPAGALVLAELVQPGFAPALLGAPIAAAMVAVALVLQAAAALCIRRIAAGRRP
jgi:tight adherence protein B